MSYVHHGRWVVGRLGGKLLQKRSARIANVNLPASDIKAAPVKRERLGQAGNSVFGYGIADRIFARRMGRDGAIIDDPSALRALGTHLAKGGAGRIKHAIEVHINCRMPCLKRQLVNRSGHAKAASIVKEHIQPPSLAHELFESRFNGAGVCHITGKHNSACLSRRDFFKRGNVAREKANTPALGQKVLSCGAPDARACACDQDRFHSSSSASSSNFGAGTTRSAVVSGAVGFERRLRTTQRSRSSARVIAT